MSTNERYCDRGRCVQQGGRWGVQKVGAAAVSNKRGARQLCGQAGSLVRPAEPDVRMAQLIEGADTGEVLAPERFQVALALKRRQRPQPVLKQAEGLGAAIDLDGIGIAPARGAPRLSWKY